MSYQLYCSIGIGLGVVRVTSKSNNQIVMQLWSMPSQGYNQSITDQLSKGHRAAIIILTENDIDDLEILLKRVSEVALDTMTIVYLGPEEDISEINTKIQEMTNHQSIVGNADSVQDTISGLASELDNQYFGKATSTLVLSINPLQCPPYLPTPEGSRCELSSDEEIATISRYADEIGVDVENSIAHFAIKEGNVEINLSSGVIHFSPFVCTVCSRTCTRRTSLCIISATPGWATETLEERALLTIAKLEGLASRNLPKHVERQIKYASNCSSFKLGDEKDEEALTFLSELGLKPRKSKWNLIEEAKKRVKENRLSPNAFNILMRCFKNQKKKEVNFSW